MSNDASGIGVSVIRCGTAVNYNYHFCATATGGSSGHYWFAWFVSVCDTSDNCSPFYEYDNGDDISTFAFTAPADAAYIEVQALAHESGNPNYTSGKSPWVLARGPLWGQGTGNLNVPCSASDYPLVEVDYSTSPPTVRNYTRDYCSGQKKYQP